MSRRAFGAALVVGALVLAMTFRADHGEPLDPDNTSPVGARALVLLLEEFAAEVEVRDVAPSSEHDVAVLLDDRLSPAAAAAVEQWVFTDGGTLVVADPASPFVAPLVVGAHRAPNDRIERGRCSVRSLMRVDTVEIAAPVLLGAQSLDGRCFGDDDGAYVAVRSYGSGHIVALGGAGVWTNAGLDRSDNAVLAVSLLAPRPSTSVAVLRRELDVSATVSQPAPEAPSLQSERGERHGQVGGGTSTILDQLPVYLRWVAAQLFVAWLVYAAARGRRLGRPVNESQPVHLAGSEIVRAMGRLLRRASPSDSVAMLMDDLRRDLRKEFALSAHAHDEAIVDALDEAGVCPPERIRDLFATRSVSTDAQLVDCVRRIDDLRQEVTRVRSSPAR